MNRVRSFGSNHRYISSLSSSEHFISNHQQNNHDNNMKESEIYEKLSKERPMARKTLTKALHSNICIIIGFIIIGFVVLLFIFAVQNNNNVFFHSNSKLALSNNNNFRKNICTSEKCQRLANYCTLQSPLGVEGLKYMNTSKYELYSILITMRHGDRSPIHSIPGDIYNTISSDHKHDESLTAGVSSQSITKINQINSPSPPPSSSSSFSSSFLYNPKALNYANEYLNRFRINLIKSNGDSISSNTLNSILNKRSSTTTTSATTTTSMTSNNKTINHTKSTSNNHVIHAIDTNGTFSIFSVSDTDLPQGHLTSTGYMQLIQLGDHLKAAYLSFLLTVNSTNQVYIRSTNYHRTIQSVAALGTRFLPPLAGPLQYPINTYLNELDEIMHGVGMKYSSHKVDKIKGETPLQGSCIKAYNLSKTQSNSFQLSEELKQKLEVLMEAKVLKERPITNLVDATLPKYCHQQPLPCMMIPTTSIISSSTISTTATTNTNTNNNDNSNDNHTNNNANKLRKNTKDEEKEKEEEKLNQGTSQCLSITEELLADMMTEADRNFCQHYTGSNGGDLATKLAIYPFVQEILMKLKQAALSPSPPPSSSSSSSSTSSSSSSSSTTTPREKIIIFSGHDTVISPVLTALGVYQNKEFCYWPPLASRIVFELWKSKDNDYGNSNSNNSNNRIKMTTSTTTSTSTIATSMFSSSSSSSSPIQKRKGGSGNNKKKKQNKLKNDSNANNSNDNSMLLNSFYVRVLFNGQDITSRIPGCYNNNNNNNNNSKDSSETTTTTTTSTGQQQQQYHSVSKNDNTNKNDMNNNNNSNNDHNHVAVVGTDEIVLCPFNVLEQLFASMLSPYKNFHDACKY